MRNLVKARQNILIGVNQGFGLHSVLREAMNAGWRTIAISPAQAPYQGKFAFENFLAPDIMNINQIEEIFHTIQKSHPEAIIYAHPVWGYWSERRELAELCQAFKFKFVGPKPDLIEKYGDKIAAREIMSKLGIPIIPGYHGKDRSFATIKKKINELGGYPIIVKDPNGGGGRGNRTVRTNEELVLAMETFPNFFIEKLLQGRWKQIEIQFFRGLILPWRDTTVQHLNQKWHEFAMNPRVLRYYLPEEVIKKLESTANIITQQFIHDGYEFAATGEFLVNLETGEYFFLEMNTRLQIEHGVSGLVAGVDIIKMLRMAAAGIPVSEHFIQQLNERNIPFEPDASDQELLDLLIKHGPNFAGQLRLYGRHSEVEISRDFNRLFYNAPIKDGLIETVHIPEHPQGFIDCYWQPGMKVDTSAIDTMFGIGYAVGPYLKQVNTTLFEQLEQTQVTGRNIATNFPTGMAWLKEHQNIGHENSTLGRFSQFQQSWVASSPMEHEPHSEGHYTSQPITAKFS